MIQFNNVGYQIAVLINGYSNMKLSEIKAKLAATRLNGAYIEQPFFSSNERIYITQNGSLFWERFCGGTTSVVPTTLTCSEENADDWYFRNWHQSNPSKSIRG